ncbi:MAG TPA: hypothetical protein VJV78_40035 [Polyangiales bacterium]|nr:hypothetical protein [Polyangiales bacterium]
MTTAALRFALLLLWLPACFGTEPDEDEEQRTATGPISSVCVSPTPEVQTGVSRRLDLAGGVTQPTFGTECGAVGDEGCALTLKNGELDRSMFCHPAMHVCVRSCMSSSQCPLHWTCDTRNETLEKSGKPFCVNANCSST